MATAFQSEISQQQIEEWFDDLVQSFEVDRLSMLTNTVESEKKEVYSELMAGNGDKLAAVTRTSTAQYFISKIVTQYFQELKDRNISLNKLAFDLSDFKVLIWAEIEDNNEKVEDELILAEAKINSIFSEHRLNISTTIVEKSDAIPVPPQYKSVKTK